LNAVMEPPMVIELRTRCSSWAGSINPRWVSMCLVDFFFCGVTGVLFFLGRKVSFRPPSLLCRAPAPFPFVLSWGCSFSAAGFLILARAPWRQSLGVANAFNVLLLVVPLVMSVLADVVPSSAVIVTVNSDSEDCLESYDDTLAFWRERTLAFLALSATPTFWESPAFSALANKSREPRRLERKRCTIVLLRLDDSLRGNAIVQFRSTKV